MTVTTRSPSTVVSSGAWLLVLNTFASDTLRATLSTSGSSSFVVGGFDFSQVPGTDLINSVTIRVQHYENQTTQNRFYVELFNSGTSISSITPISTRTTEGYDAVVLTGISNAQLNGIEVRVEGAKQGGGGSRSFNVNHVELIVDHTPLTPPSAPSLTVTADSPSQITASWTNAANTDSTDLEVDGVVLTGQTSPYVHSGLTASTSHTYRVRGINGAGAGSWSTLITRSTLPPPNPPSNFAASAVSSSQINLTWTQPGDATSVDLEIDSVVVTGAVSPRQHTGLSPSSTHNYRVRSVSSGGPGPWSTTYSATTLPLPPNPPSNLSAAASGPYAVDVTWSQPLDATSSDLEIDGIVATSVASPYSHTGLLSQSTHSYRVRGVNSGGAGAWSNLVSVTTPAPVAPRSVDAGSPSDVATATYDASTPTASYDLTLDGGPPPDQAPYKIRVNGVYRTIAKFRMNGVDRTVASFRLNGTNLV